MTKPDGQNEADDADLGKVRLFPLPNFVMFPHVVKGLHIFEPRYCDMLRDALATDQRITMACLLDGWQKDYHVKPPIYNTVCVGKIIHHTPTDDGRHNILLAGLYRAKVLHEISSNATFRYAQIEPIEDSESGIDEEGLKKLFKVLLNAFRHSVPHLVIDPIFQDSSLQKMTLGMLTDIIAHLLPLGYPVKRLLLSEPNVVQRTKVLLELLSKDGTVPDTIFKCDSSPKYNRDDFPPNFSRN